MNAFWLVIPVFLGWMALGVFAVLVLKRMAGLARFVAGMIFTVILVGGFALGLYVLGEFVANKGPDDWGALWHAGYPLAAKYQSSNDTSYEGKGFEKDPDNSGSGTYLTHFSYAGHTGIVRSHYNVTTHKFDHDEIMPDN
jgi:hypothetical protein